MILSPANILDSPFSNDRPTLLFPGENCRCNPQDSHPALMLHFCRYKDGQACMLGALWAFHISGQCDPTECGEATQNLDGPWLVLVGFTAKDCASKCYHQVSCDPLILSSLFWPCVSPMVHTDQVIRRALVCCNG